MFCATQGRDVRVVQCCFKECSVYMPYKQMKTVMLKENTNIYVQNGNEMLIISVIH